MPESQKLFVLGGGPGGYTAAFYAADLGLDVTLIDKAGNPGGVCLYRGCIPSKALLHAVKVIRDAEEAAGIGITFQKMDVDLVKLRSWKESVVNKLTGGLGALSKQRKITFVQGTASFTSSNSLEIEKVDGKVEQMPYDKCILATGSESMILPGADADSEHIWDSTDALELKEIPESLLVVGGGYIGMELGSVYAKLGSKVTVVEMLSGLMPGADRDLVQVFLRRSKALFTDIHLQAKVTAIETSGNGVKVSIEPKKGELFQKNFKKVLVAIGRQPNSENIGLINTRVNMDDRGFVTVHPNRQTDDPSIYAIGDVVGGPLLAHKASHEGRVAVDAVLGKKTMFEPLAIPGVVYTDPEIAFTGLTETEAKDKGIDATILKFPWQASGRALAMANTDGLTKLILDPNSGRVLGMGIVGQGAGEMISEGSLAIEMGANAQDLALTIHPHPTLSETVMEAAEMLEGTCTHIYRPKRT